MQEIHNLMTDTLKLVNKDIIQRRWFNQVFNSEEGFGLEHFRGGVHLGSLRSNQMPTGVQIGQQFQALGAKDGDTIYRINLGPKVVVVEGSLRTLDGYTRAYKVSVELQVSEPSLLISLYLQEADPVHLAILGIQEAIQDYANRTIYENIHPTNIQGKARYAFDGEPGRSRAGIRILRTYQPAVDADSSYQPVNPKPILLLQGSLTTLEGYVRNYEVKVELHIIDLAQYKYLEATKAEPLQLARTTIDGELQRYARQKLYEDLSELQLSDVAEHAFNTSPKQAVGGLHITHAYGFSLAPDRTYRPIVQSPLLHVSGKLTTAERYERDYTVDMELEVTDRLIYLQLEREGSAPLGLVQTAIHGAIQGHAIQQTYENLSEAHLQDVVEHALDDLASRVRGGLKIVRAHKFLLQAAPDYKSVGSLELAGTIETTDHRERAYEMTVELEVGDAPRFVQLTREGNDPLNLVKAAIEGAIQRATHGKEHNALHDVDLREAAEEVFKEVLDQMIGGLKLVKARKVSLHPDPKIKEKADITYRKEVEETEVRREAELVELVQKLESQRDLQARQQEFERARLQQAIEKMRYQMQLEKDDLKAISQFRRNLLQIAMEQAEQSLEADADVKGIIAKIENLLNLFPRSVTSVSEQVQLQNLQHPEILTLKAGQVSSDTSQATETIAPSELNKINDDRIGWTLIEVSVPLAIRHLLDKQDRAFQVRRLVAGEAARCAGIQKGDFLVEIDGQPAYTTESIIAAFDSIQEGHEVEITVVRDGCFAYLTLVLPHVDDK